MTRLTYPGNNQTRLLALAALAVVLCALPVEKLKAQSYEARVLLLDVDKLRQLKKTLHAMQAGYQALREHYQMLLNLAEGSFRLHRAFLDSLWTVRASVRSYPGLQTSLTTAEHLVSRCREGLRDAATNPWLPPGDAAYASHVYQAVLLGAAGGLARLNDAVTSYRQRMTDAERLTVIDEVSGELTDALSFTRYFSSQVMLTGRLRFRQYRESGALKTLY